MEFKVIDMLRKILSCDCVDGREVTHAILEEKDRLAKLKKLTLSDLKPGMLVLMIDEGRKVYYRQKNKTKIAAVCMSPLFRSGPESEENAGKKWNSQSFPPSTFFSL